jgi:hypothetical protein
VTASMSNLETSLTREMHHLAGDLRSIGNRMDSFESGNVDQVREFRDAIDSRFAGMEEAAEMRFRNFRKEMEGVAPAASSAPAASTAASSAGPGRAAGPARASPTRSDENCLVIVRDFPEELPRSVLRETFEELLLFVPSSDRREVHSRINPVDKQIILVFPTSAKADSFLETFRAKGFVFVDQDSDDDFKLSAKKGRPLAVRRRGGAIHPVYAATATIISSKTAFKDAKLVPNPRMKAGVMHSEFHAQVGRKATPLFSLVFREDQHETAISAVIFAGGSVFSEDECTAIRASAGLQ